MKSEIPPIWLLIAKIIERICSKLFAVIHIVCTKHAVPSNNFAALPVTIVVFSISKKAGESRYHQKDSGSVAQFV